MKKRLFLLFIAASMILHAGQLMALDISVQSGLQYDWWEDDDNGSATQLYVPLSVDVEHRNYSVGLLAGYASTHIEKYDGSAESLSAALDTKLNFSYSISGNLPLDILIGLDLNLPTGHTNFSQEELIIIMDPDLISINNFGQGFNINPTLNVVKNWGDWVAGAGIGYLWRGEYDFSEAVNDYDPGDIINASAEVRYYFLPEWNARLFGFYAYYGKDEVGGDEYAQEGKHYLLGIGLDYDQIEWSAGTNFRGVFRDRSKFEESAGVVVTEDNNSQGNEWIGDLYWTYNLNDRTTLQTIFQGLYLAENGYSSDSPNFTGSRKKWTLQAGLTRIFADKIRGELNFRGFVMDDAATNFPEPRDSTSYKGLTAMLMVSTVF